jgi:hypothetical protein
MKSVTCLLVATGTRQLPDSTRSLSADRPYFDSLFLPVVSAVFSAARAPDRMPVMP